jgi:hypothetical protein
MFKLVIFPLAKMFKMFKLLETRYFYAENIW